MRPNSIKNFYEEDLTSESFSADTVGVTLSDQAAEGMMRLITMQDLGKAEGCDGITNEI